MDDDASHLGRIYCWNCGNTDEVQMTKREEYATRKPLCPGCWQANHSLRDRVVDL